MQTIFLVWLPGIAAIIFGGGVAVWLAGKGLEALAKARAIRARDRLFIDSTDLLKEVCGLQTYLPDDLQRRIDRQIAELETVTRKELT